MRNRTHRLKRVFAGYEQDHLIPLGAYAVSLGVYNALLAAFVTSSARKRAGQEFPTKDLLLVALAIHKFSRIITKGAVTAPLRAAFSQYEEDLGYGEVNERARGRGFRQSIGELLTCNYCMDMWVGLGALTAYRYFPTPARVMMTLFATVAGADFLHVIYEAVRTHENLLTLEERDRTRRPAA